MLHAQILTYRGLKMDIYTKFFLANLVAIFSTATIDQVIFRDKLKKLVVVGSIIAIWGLLTIISIPTWFIYLIVTL